MGLVIILSLATPLFYTVSQYTLSEAAYDVAQQNSQEDTLAMIGNSSLVSVSSMELPPRIVQVIPVVITAYSSTVWQTDNDPFITAAGTPVREGIVAANFLPFGTKIQIPELYGDRVFVVEDRMNPRKRNMVDVWFPYVQDARNFGVQRTSITVLEG